MSKQKDLYALHLITIEDKGDHKAVGSKNLGYIQTPAVYQAVIDGMVYPTLSTGDLKSLVDELERQIPGFPEPDVFKSLMRSYPVISTAVRKNGYWRSEDGRRLTIVEVRFLIDQTFA